MRKIELLAPARTADIGIEAINHGADAVYIGAPAFSARAAAGNAVSEIEKLATYGHRFGAKTIVALNTILTDLELQQAERLTWKLYEAGVDALIIQDLGLLQLNLPPIELHASTQMDNRSIEKVRLLQQLGLTRVVMARELSVSQIRAIHEAVPDVELECFIHGALCVCISGQCYLSSALNGRSANRGECSQPCRLPIDLYGINNNIGQTLIARQRHLLSLRDMNRAAYLEHLIEAGVTSLKIEGRLKDLAYVKNVVASYRVLIDRLIEQHNAQSESDIWKSESMGHCTYTFEPKLDKSFNRGFTSYFAEGKREPMWNFDSPKSVGERIGVIESVKRDSFLIKPDTNAETGSIIAELHNGDGLAVGSFGFRLNRYEPQTHTCFPLDGAKVCRQLHKGQILWRNRDTLFEQILAKPSAKRVLPVSMSFVSTGTDMTLSMYLKENPEVNTTVSLQGSFESSIKDQHDNILRQLSKLGDTIFFAANIKIDSQGMFIPSSMLSDLRRQACRQLEEVALKVQTALRTDYVPANYPKRAEALDARGILPASFLANVMNQQAKKTYASMGISNVSDAFELQSVKEGIVMQTRHCLRYAFGQCPRFVNPNPENLLDKDFRLGSESILKIGNKKFILKFGCKNDCISEIFTIFAPD